MSWWEWSDPAFVLSLLGVVVATAGVFATIAVAVVVEKSRRAEDQRADLERSERMSRDRLRRRDELLQIIPALSSPYGISRVWVEIVEWPDTSDRRWLQAEFRANPSTPLPGVASRVTVFDPVDTCSASDYIASLSTRYTRDEGSLYPFPGLIDFLRTLERRGVKPGLDDRILLIQLVTSGPAADVQCPGQQFFRELVRASPWTAGQLFYRVERIPSDAKASRRINVLAGVLLAGVDVIEHRGILENARRYGIRKLQNDYLQALAELLHRGVIAGIPSWGSESRTDRVSATIAWLVNVVGWTIRGDSNLAMRAIENLSVALNAIPTDDWDSENNFEHVKNGLTEIARKAPLQWIRHGPAIRAAVAKIEKEQR